jgi:uncharacterized membrane protein YheB (UPF0754 family)
MPKSWQTFVETLRKWLEKESNHNHLSFEIIENDIEAFKSQIQIKATHDEKNKKARMIFRKSKYLEMKGYTDIEICSYITQVLKDHFREKSQRKYFIPFSWLKKY